MAFSRIYSRALQTSAGISLTPDEIMKAAERTTNLQKAFNSRLGLRRSE
jgi:aldehyde:ferredoxin oxidoreductase